MDRRTNAYPAGPHHRHQSSLQDIWPVEIPAMDDDTRTQAGIRMRHILQHCEVAAAIQQPRQGYNRPVLIRLTHDHARSDDSKTIFLSTFFEHLQLPLTGSITDSDVNFSDTKVEERFRKSVDAFADYLMDNFYLPLKTVANRTPQPSPMTHSALQRAQGSAFPEDVVGTPTRISTLRGECLLRDKHRCVISRKFDMNEGHKRHQATQGNATDDDGEPIMSNGVEHLEVAHILPHSLVDASADSLLDSTRKATLDILNMFDVGVVRMIEGVEIDRPFNAITLSMNHHLKFGSFQIFFEGPLSNQPPHTYRIDAFDDFIGRALGLPVTRTLHLTEDRNIDPPSPRLLAIHCAIGHILHLSGAGDYIDRIWRDAEEHGVRHDGSTDIRTLISWKLSECVGVQS
ncbi:hypothetical protein RB595_004840 [Gaeumannomyces hyphopodioides]